MKDTRTAPLALGAENFDLEVLGSDVPVLVDFWAAWCAPCRAIAPIVEGLAADHSDKVKVAKIDADENPAIFERYGVSSIPTLLFFRDGEVVERITGLVRREVLEEKLLSLVEPA